MCGLSNPSISCLSARQLPLLAFAVFVFLISGCAGHHRFDEVPRNTSGVGGQVSVAEGAALSGHQRQLIRQLSHHSKPERFWIDVRQGSVRQMVLSLAPNKLQLPDSATVQEMAEGFLKQYGELLAVPDADDVFRLTATKGKDRQNLIYIQTIDGIPVLGSWLKFTLASEQDGPVITRFSGRYITDPGRFRFTPSLNAVQAEEIVAKAQGLTSAEALRRMQPTELWIYDHALNDPALLEHKLALAWRIIIDSPGEYVAREVFVDAANGRILASVPWRQEANFELWNAGGLEPSTNLCEVPSGYSLWFTEAGVAAGASPDEEGERVYDNIADVYEFFDVNFGRNHIVEDEESCAVLSYVHLHGDWNNRAFAQRGYLGTSPDGCWSHAVAFGDQATTLDTVAHELAHAFHWSEANYLAVTTTRTVAEHVADAFAHFIGDWNGRDTDWLMFEDRPDGPLRNMADPPAIPVDPTICASDYPDVYKVGSHPGELLCQDPHILSTVLSKALYLMVEGGEHRGYTIRGLGESPIRDLYYRIVTEELHSGSVVLDFAESAVAACEDRPGYADCCQVRNALASVGVARMDLDCDGIPEGYDASVWTPENRINSLDNCPDEANLDQNDMDEDGIGDVCDDDMDGDGFSNDDDNCPAVVNGSQRDDDGDGIGNFCDNCWYEENPRQENLDGDTWGDACDPDIENDGVWNPYDNCPETPGISGSGEYGLPGPFEILLCMPGYHFSLGCPCRRPIEHGHLSFTLTEDMLGPLPQSPPRLFKVLDLCKFVDCDDPALDEEQGIIVEAMLATALPEVFKDGDPVTVYFAIRDPSNAIVAQARTLLSPKSAGTELEQTIRLAFRPDLEALQANGTIDTAPYQLQIAIDFVSGATRSMFKATTFQLEARVWDIREGVIKRQVPQDDLREQDASDVK